MSQQHHRRQGVTTTTMMMSNSSNSSVPQSVSVNRLHSDSIVDHRMNDHHLTFDGTEDTLETMTSFADDDDDNEQRSSSHNVISKRQRVEDTLNSQQQVLHQDRPMKTGSSWSCLYTSTVLLQQEPDRQQQQSALIHFFVCKLKAMYHYGVNNSAVSSSTCSTSASAAVATTWNGVDPLPVPSNVVTSSSASGAAIFAHDLHELNSPSLLMCVAEVSASYSHYSVLETVILLLYTDLTNIRLIVFFCNLIRYLEGAGLLGSSITIEYQRDVGKAYRLMMKLLTIFMSHFYSERDPQRHLLQTLLKAWKSLLQSLLVSSKKKSSSCSDGKKSSHMMQTKEDSENVNCREVGEWDDGKIVSDLFRLFVKDDQIIQQLLLIVSLLCSSSSYVSSSRGFNSSSMKLSGSWKSMIHASLWHHGLLEVLFAVIQYFQFHGYMAKVMMIALNQFLDTINISSKLSLSSSTAMNDQEQDTEGDDVVINPFDEEHELQYAFVSPTAKVTPPIPSSFSDQYAPHFTTWSQLLILLLERNRQDLKLSHILWTTIYHLCRLFGEGISSCLCALDIVNYLVNATTISLESNNKHLSLMIQCIQVVTLLSPLSDAIHVPQDQSMYDFRQIFGQERQGLVLLQRHWDQLVTRAIRRIHDSYLKGLEAIGTAMIALLNRSSKNCESLIASGFADKLILCLKEICLKETAYLDELNGNGTFSTGTSSRSTRKAMPGGKLEVGATTTDLSSKGVIQPMSTVMQSSLRLMEISSEILLILLKYYRDHLKRIQQQQQQEQQHHQQLLIDLLQSPVQQVQEENMVTTVTAALDNDHVSRFVPFISQVAINEADELAESNNEFVVVPAAVDLIRHHHHQQHASLPVENSGAISARSVSPRSSSHATVSNDISHTSSQCSTALKHSTTNMTSLHPNITTSSTINNMSLNSTLNESPFFTTTSLGIEALLQVLDRRKTCIRLVELIGSLLVLKCHDGMSYNEFNDTVHHAFPSSSLSSSSTKCRQWLSEKPTLVVSMNRLVLSILLYHFVNIPSTADMIVASSSTTSIQALTNILSLLLISLSVSSAPITYNYLCQLLQLPMLNMNTLPTSTVLISRVISLLCTTTSVISTDSLSKSLTSAYQESKSPSKIGLLDLIFYLFSVYGGSISGSENDIGNDMLRRVAIRHQLCDILLLIVYMMGPLTFASNNSMGNEKSTVHSGSNKNNFGGNPVMSTIRKQAWSLVVISYLLSLQVPITSHTIDNSLIHKLYTLCNVFGLEMTHIPIELLLRLFPVLISLLSIDDHRQQLQSDASTESPLCSLSSLLLEDTLVAIVYRTRSEGQIILDKISMKQELVILSMGLLKRILVITDRNIAQSTSSNLVTQWDLVDQSLVSCIAVVNADTTKTGTENDDQDPLLTEMMTTTIELLDKMTIEDNKSWSKAILVVCDLFELLQFDTLLRQLVCDFVNRLLTERHVVRICCERMHVIIVSLQQTRDSSNGGYTSGRRVKRKKAAHPGSHMSNSIAVNGVVEHQAIDLTGLLEPSTTNDNDIHDYSLKLKEIMLILEQLDSIAQLINCVVAKLLCVDDFDHRCNLHEWCQDIEDTLYVLEENNLSNLLVLNSTSDVREIILMMEKLKNDLVATLQSIKSMIVTETHAVSKIAPLANDIIDDHDEHDFLMCFPLHELDDLHRSNTSN